LCAFEILSNILFLSITRVSATSRVDNLKYNEETFTTSTAKKPNTNNSSSSSNSSSCNDEEEAAGIATAAEVTRGTACVHGYVHIHDN